DGALGLEAINAEGGITIAQGEKIAKNDGMPHSAINAGCVDFVLPPERIAGELARLARHLHVYQADAVKAGKGWGGNRGTTSGKLSEAQLRRKLRATREYLQSVIEQRGAYVEELRSANEELQSSNLELQSVSEELKTVKQELQSRNDQLEQDKENLRLQ